MKLLKLSCQGKPAGSAKNLAHRDTASYAMMMIERCVWNAVSMASQNLATMKMPNPALHSFVWCCLKTRKNCLAQECRARTKLPHKNQLRLKTSPALLYLVTRQLAAGRSLYNSAVEFLLCYKWNFQCLKVILMSWMAFVVERGGSTVIGVWSRCWGFNCKLWVDDVLLVMLYYAASLLACEFLFIVPSRPLDNIWFMMIVWRISWEDYENCFVLCYAHWCEQFIQINCFMFRF